MNNTETDKFKRVALRYLKRIIENTTSHADYKLRAAELILQNCYYSFDVNAVIEETKDSAKSADS